MGNDKNFVEEITNIEEDFAKWYTDIVKKAELCDYSSVKGCMIIRPDGFAIWENIQKELDKAFKKTGVRNCAMPMLIPESLLNKEKEHVIGFAPEVAWVTMGGNEKLEERLCVRPTSETLFCDYYSNIVKSHRDLPQLLNQWVSVVRWEKTTRPFLRSREFYWQEGHTAHVSEEDAIDRTMLMLNLYADFCEKILAIPVIKGQKTEKERFAGAVSTYTVESIMKDGKALQSATSHNFSDGFAKAYKIQYLDKNNTLQYVHQTSWGISTRIIGAIIMVHGDNSGLKLPPKIAPIQVRIIPIRIKDDEVINKSKEILDLLLSNNIRSDIDLSDKTPGFKFSDAEMRGIPLRIEIGPKDIKEGNIVLVRRDTREKIIIKVNDDLCKEVNNILDDIQNNMYNTAKEFLDSHIVTVKTKDALIDAVVNKHCFAVSMHCGDSNCEEALKNETSITSRCIPFDESKISDTCAVCGKKAKYKIVWGLAY